MNPQKLYNKIQSISEGVWVINNGDVINTLSIPLFIDYSRKRSPMRKYIGGLVIGIFILFIFLLVLLVLNLLSDLTG